MAAGFDPRGQNGTAWNGNALTVATIYNTYYTQNRTNTPTSGTAGYVFTGWQNGVPLHMEFYDYRDGGANYTRYDTNGINPSQQVPTSPTANSQWVYVLLPQL